MKALFQIPYETDSAAGNMALDTFLLEECQRQGNPFCRWYGWSEAAMSFGYSQSRDSLNSQLGDFQGSLVRRPTGGGLVDHRSDLTYALAIPSTHPLHRLPAPTLYLRLHQLLALQLQLLGFAVQLAPCPGPCSGPRQAPIACFPAPQPHDLIEPVSQSKIAGAAMKRTRLGLLVQGSLLPGPFPGLSPSRLHQAWAEALAQALSLPLRFAPPPAENARAPLRHRYASSAWNSRR